tara:strand:+ start:3132 stop:3425 length:294 start_codon:yes stop_codon:yes gene_type:complete
MVSFYSPITSDDPADGEREVTTLWIMDSNEFVLSQAPPYDDMWQEWNLGERPVAGEVVDELAWWDKYNLTMLPRGNVPIHFLYHRGHRSRPDTDYTR